MAYLLSTADAEGKFTESARGMLELQSSSSSSVSRNSTTDIGLGSCACTSCSRAAVINPGEPGAPTGAPVEFATPTACGSRSGGTKRGVSKACHPSTASVVVCLTRLSSNATEPPDSRVRKSLRRQR
eukprot:scaffold72087_cov55-Phaeocystis_antarctica.AAC.1